MVVAHLFAASRVISQQSTGRGEPVRAKIHPYPLSITGDPVGDSPTVASTADFKNGLVLVIDGQLWQINEVQHVKPGKGPAFVRTKLKNVLSGKVVDKTYNAGVKVETATVDRRDATYLFRDGTDFVFMDSQDYEQHPLPESLGGKAAGFLREGFAVPVR